MTTQLKALCILLLEITTVSTVPAIPAKENDSMVNSIIIFFIVKILYGKIQLSIKKAALLRAAFKI